MDTETLVMILKMSAAVAMYVAATALAWRFWQKREKTLPLRVAAGVFFGLCCIASNHLGIEYGLMMLNVRDIGPLAAGLLFDPLSGILAGLIGGVERYLIGEFWQIGSFTRVACGLSTALAGFLAAAMHLWIYERKTPLLAQAFMTGATMEVFHMYAVLLTNRDSFDMAYYVVQVCSIPMIVFTALGVALCVLAVQRRSHDRPGKSALQSEERTPVFAHFRRGLLTVTVILFVLSVLVGYGSQLQLSAQRQKREMEIKTEELKYYFRDLGNDIEAMKTVLKNQSLVSGEYDSAALLLDTEDALLLRPVGGEAEEIRLKQEELDFLLARRGRDAFTGRLKWTGDEEAVFVCAPLTDRYCLICWSYAALARTSGEFMLYDMIFSNILIFSTLYLLISLMVEKIVVQKLREVNRSLARITAGDLEEKVSVRTSLEFAELSDDINRTVDALKGYIDEAERRMEKDLKLASAIQESALPKNFSFPRSEFEIYALMDPAREVGGDFYDFFFLDIDRMALVIADVSGKSVPGAMFMMQSKATIKNAARSGLSPKQILSRVNDTLCEGNDAEMFVTVWLGIIDLRTGKMRCANAGHEYPILLRAGGSYEVFRDPHGMALAVLEGVPVKEYEMDLNPGDRLFVYTDGIPEAISETEEAYGLERLTDALNGLKDASEEETLRAVLRDVEAFAGRAEQFDDITMLGFAYRGA